MYFSALSKSFLASLVVALGACSSDIPYDGTSSYYDQSSAKIEKQKIGRPYQINGRWYKPQIDMNYDEVGLASWYGPGFDGRPTANGEIFDEEDISAAHRTLPLPSYVIVTNLDTQKQIYVRVNDRGPFYDDRIIDLSKKAAEILGIKDKGVGRVRVQLAEPPKNVTLLSPDGNRMTGKGYAGNQKPQSNQRETQSANIPIEPQENNQSATLQPLKAPPAAPITPTLKENNTSSMTDLSKQSSSVMNYQTAAQPVSIQKFQPETIARLPAINSKYAVKVGVFSNPENAQKLGQDIAQLGQVQLSEMVRNGAKLTKVSLAGFQSQKDAAKAIDALSKFGINDAKLIKN